MTDTPKPPAPPLSAEEFVTQLNQARSERNWAQRKLMDLMAERDEARFARDAYKKLAMDNAERWYAQSDYIARLTQTLEALRSAIDIEFHNGRAADLPSLDDLIRAYNLALDRDGIDGMIECPVAAMRVMAIDAALGSKPKEST